MKLTEKNPLIKMLFESVTRNKIGNRGNRYDRDWMLFWMFVYISGGRFTYRIIASNLKCIPAERTLTKNMESVCGRYQDGNQFSFNL